MNSIHKHVLAVAALTLATQGFAEQITFFGREGFEGRHVTIDGTVDSLEHFGFRDRVSSAVVVGQWEVCNGPDFTGRCVILMSGEYPSLRESGLSGGVSSARAASAGAYARSHPHIVFYEQPGFRGQMFGSDVPILNLDRLGLDVEVEGIRLKMIEDDFAVNDQLRGTLEKIDHGDAVAVDVANPTDAVRGRHLQYRFLYVNVVTLARPQQHAMRPKSDVF